MRLLRKSFSTRSHPTRPSGENDCQPAVLLRLSTCCYGDRFRSVTERWARVGGASQVRS